MNKYVRGLMIAGTVASLALGTVAFAKETPRPSPSNKESSQLEKLKEKVQDLRDRIASKSQEMRNKEDEKKNKEEHRKNELKKFWENMSHRLSILIRNEVRLSDQINKKLDKMAEKGKDVTALRTQLDSANKLIKDAQDTLKANDVKAQDLVKNSTDPKATLKQLKDLVQQVVDKIKAAHKALVGVMSAIKGASTSPSPTPTPSGSVSPSPSSTVSPSATPTPSAT